MKPIVDVVRGPDVMAYESDLDVVHYVPARPLPPGYALCGAEMQRSRRCRRAAAPVCQACRVEASRVRALVVGLP